MKKKKGIKKICHVCKKEIDSAIDHYVELATFNRKSMKSRNKLADEHLFYHISCWRDYFENCVQKRLNILLGGIQRSAINLLSSPLISSFAGIFGSPETKTHIEHGRKKRKEKSRQ